MQKQQVGSQFSRFLKSGSLLSILIIVNVALWLLSLLFPLIDYLYTFPAGRTRQGWYDLFSLSSQWELLVRRPWTLLTYMFLHEGFWHLLFNMVMLYFGGLMCCRYLNAKRFAWIYFLSGMGGGLLYLLVYNLFPVGQLQVSTMVGASAAVMGVLLAVAAYVPNQEVGFWMIRTFTVKMKYLVLVFLVIDLLSIPVSNAGGHIAHLGGALIGFLFVMVMRWRLQRPARPKHQRIKVKKAAGYKPAGGRQGRPLSDDEFNRRRADDQKRIDAILDKISKSGYDHLTKEEKDFLFRKS